MLNCYFLTARHPRFRSRDQQLPSSLRMTPGQCCAQLSFSISWRDVISLMNMLKNGRLIVSWRLAGNIPQANAQYYSSPYMLLCFKRLVDMFVTLSPYHQHVVNVTSTTGLPAQRPLFLEYVALPLCYREEFRRGFVFVFVCIFLLSFSFFPSF